MACTLKIDRCMVKGVKSFTSEKNGRTYESLVISIGVEDAEIGCGQFDLSQVPTLLPVSIEAQIDFRRVGFRTFVEFAGAAPNIRPA